MKSVRRISDVFDRIVNVLAIAAMVIIAFVMLLVCTEVVTRQLFDLPIKGSVEIASYSLVFITFLRLARCYVHEVHDPLIFQECSKPRHGAFLRPFLEIIEVCVERREPLCLKQLHRF